MIINAAIRPQYVTRTSGKTTHGDISGRRDVVTNEESCKEDASVNKSAR
jgi:hypothetical protein